jgi:hypothetical protein
MARRFRTRKPKERRGGVGELGRVLLSTTLSPSSPILPLSPTSLVWVPGGSPGWSTTRESRRLARRIDGGRQPFLQPRASSLKPQCGRSPGWVSVSSVSEKAARPSQTGSPPHRWGSLRDMHPYRICNFGGSRVVVNYPEDRAHDRESCSPAQSRAGDGSSGGGVGSPPT